jgi:NhaP-type Na+/H+ or K+/H+ antiporter
MFEHYRQPILPRRLFFRRLSRFAGAALLLVAVSWLIGIVGYHWLEGLSWIDSVLNAAMILGGMGPVNPLHTNLGKLFASVYALFSGMVFLVSVGVLVAPILHRVLHQFHLEADAQDEQT